MASIQPRRNADGTLTYRVMYRVNGALRSTAFRDALTAGDFVKLVDKIGGDAAMKLRDVRASATTASQPRRAVRALPRARHRRHRRHDRRVPATRRPDLARRLGLLPVDAVSRDQVARWVGVQAKTPTRRGTPSSAKTIKNAHSLLSTVLGWVKVIALNSSSAIHWRPLEEKRRLRIR